MRGRNLGCEESSAGKPVRESKGQHDADHCKPECKNRRTGDGIGLMSLNLCPAPQESLPTITRSALKTGLRGVEIEIGFCSVPPVLLIFAPTPAHCGPIAGGFFCAPVPALGAAKPPRRPWQPPSTTQPTQSRVSSRFSDQIKGSEVESYQRVHKKGGPSNCRV